jgi:hypothetical protein
MNAMQLDLTNKTPIIKTSIISGIFIYFDCINVSHKCQSIFRSNHGPSEQELQSGLFGI